MKRNVKRTYKREIQTAITERKRKRNVMDRLLTNRKKKKEKKTYGDAN